MSGQAAPVVVIRLVCVRGPQGSPTERGVVAAVGEGRLDTDGDGHPSYLIVSPDAALAGADAARRGVSDIRVGDVVAWIGEPYGALWVADRTPGAPCPEPEGES
jgi:hypothetical protein